MRRVARIAKSTQGSSMCQPVSCIPSSNHGRSEWVEAIPLQNVTQDTVIDFIHNHIVYRFGLPESLTTDQGTVFVGRKVAAFAECWGIKLLTSTPYYAQANGQVEAANKTLIGLIKKHVGRKPKSWHETLGQILWAYRNSATGATPFPLAHGQEAVLPAEVYLQSCRIQRQEEIPSEDYWNMMPDELVNLDEDRILALDILTRQKNRIAKAYNKKVRNRSFIVGDYVWKVILPVDKNDRAYGKWAPNWEGPFKVEKILSNNAYSVKELNGQSRRVTINGKYLKAYKPMLHEPGHLAVDCRAPKVEPTINAVKGKRSATRGRVYIMNGEGVEGLAGGERKNDGNLLNIPFDF
ncbi:uncharacterized protein LOC130735721 [Lotus japonicus]|uniref:uncharacterized protein LOC130735721 n=1 Tax=Lotus japonicus TaxID=34305 RepID=UPI0025827643|nr:uncharacterized protein LOC130735721 [Lotus japonicus]